ncbi:conserved domain protein [Streptococcus sp. oral taxon 056 str. F0418]|nr:conserved domain protein [Streptococcus sp. oral taxon 056 str. F0418]
MNVKIRTFQKILKKVLTSCLEKIKIRTIREVVNEFVF